jgi:3-dehydroquinate synthase
MTVSRFEVKTRSRVYPVIVGNNILDRIGEFLDKSTDRVFVITDDVIANLYLDPITQSLDESGIESITYILKTGESSKTLESAEKLYNFLLENLASRSDTILALGGGVIGDLAGFVASTFKRGLHLVHVPTTLLAQVDSTLGGKTGINLSNGKNLVGTFYQPHAVIVDVFTLNSLSTSDFVAGLAEVIKYGVIMDDGLIQILINGRDMILERNLNLIAEIVERALKNKKYIVETDETEEKGKREVLNFGHTVGHAIETCSNHSILHGQAVAIGMVEEARLAEIQGHLHKPALDLLITILSMFDLPTQIPDEIDIKQLNEVMRQDKKVRHGQLTIPILVEIGKTEMMVASNLSLTRSNGEKNQC